MESRTSNSIKNATFGIVLYIVTTVASFIARTIFIKVLGETYLGISGLFNDILQLLSLTELGIGTAITYAMYKPIAENDIAKIRAYMGFFKKIYVIVGCLVFMLGIVLTPFLQYLVSDIPNIPHIKMIFMLYVSNTAVSYFFAYKRCLLNAYQYNRINSINIFIFQMMQYIIQSIAIMVFSNFIVYLLIQIICTLLGNIFISIKTNKMFPEIRSEQDEKLQKDDKKELFKNVTSLFSLKLSSAIVTSTDNILISKYISTIVLGIYSNYSLIVTMVKTLFAKMFEGLTGSVGNYSVNKDSKSSLELFYNILFINYIMASIVCVAMYFIIDDFIEVWIGTGYILGKNIVILIVVNLFTRLFRSTILVFIDAYGIFRKLKLKSICEATANLVISLILLKVFDMGVEGVLLGTFLSNMLVNFWWEPYVLIKKVWNESLCQYFMKQLIYIFVIFVQIVIVLLLNNYISIENNIVSMIVNGVIVVVVFVITNLLVFGKTIEFKFLKNKFVNKIRKGNA